jgi:hypothetical protein
VYCSLTRFSGNLALPREAPIRNRVLIRLRRGLFICLIVAASSAAATDLKQEAAQGFDQYVRLTEMRMHGELAAGGGFLWADGLAEPRRSDAYARLQRGEVVSARLQTPDPSGRSSTPGALIHDWVGTVFFPGASLSQVLAIVQDYDHHAEYYKPEVTQSKMVEHNGGDFKVHYRLRKKKVVTVILDTDYEVHRHTIDTAHAYSDSYSTRIAQVENAGEPNEHELPPGKDGGYMWRLNSYWRYFESGRGVYVQCEAISLTRDIPAALNWIIAPFIESIPKESLEFTLQSTRSAVLRGGLHASE